jgi:hypothetical protein
MLNDHLFMFVNNDCPQAWANEWIPYYRDYCSAFFIMQYRFSCVDLFNEITAFPLPMKCHSTIPIWYLEQQSRLSLERSRDISVFFSGRRSVRPRRAEGFQLIEKHFPGSILNPTEKRMLSPHDYCDYMCRAKIAWCPRSVHCDPDHEENGITAKECEAMCAQTMVIRHALHVKETEPRIAGTHFVEVSSQERDLLDTIRFYLDHEEKRQEIAYNGRLWYERNWSPRATAHYLVNRCLEAMGELCEPARFGQT